MRDRVRQYGFSRQSEPRLHVGERTSQVHSRPSRTGADGLPACVLCDGPGSEFLTTAQGHALCDVCATLNHVVAPPDAECRLCGSTEPPLRGSADRAICDACLSYARAVIRGDDL